MIFFKKNIEKKTKHFKSEREQIFELLLEGYLFLCVMWVTISSVFQSEAELIEHWGNQKLTGSAGQRSAQALEMFVTNNFGKKGFIIFGILLGIIILKLALMPTILSYCRFKKREREIREGLRAPDDYVDDYVRVPLWEKVINIFTKKRKKKYPSEREMRDSLKKNKYYKE